MLLPRIVVRIFSAGLLMFCAGPICAQSYPYKTVRIVTGNIGGGGNDFISRLVAQSLSGPLGQPVIVDNRDGAMAPGLTVAKATPDGYTLLLFGTTWCNA